MKYLVLLLAFLCFIPKIALTQKEKENKDDDKIDPYTTSNWEIPAVVVGLPLMIRGYELIRRHATLDENYVRYLTKDNVNALDRLILDFNTFPASNYESAQQLSDMILNVTVVAPALLMLDKKIRNNWKDYIIIYFESHIVESFFYQGITYSIRRTRPFVYNDEVALDVRTGHQSSNSFYSGHVSTTAIGSFFMAKVYSDHHNLTRGKKRLLFGLAALPPLFQAYARTKAAKHFPTDNLIGLIMGASTGILIPELHKKTNKFNLSALPVYTPNFIGLSMRYKIK